jgi:serine/threonine-protein kinase RsbW
MCERAALPPPVPATPVPVRTCTQAFPGRLEQVREARALLARFLGACPASAEAVLLISELAANAIAHSASSRPGGAFTLRACLPGDGYLHAEIEDDGSDWDGDISAAQSPHGLYLLRALATACGTRPGNHGWITWFTLASVSEQAGQR